MMRPFRRLSGVLALLVLLLLANLSWIQVLDADAIRQRDGNTRILLEQYNKLRGPILVESAPIASSAHVSGENVYQRSYLDGPLYASVTGYYSLLYGASGIERVENGVLSGNDPRLFVDRVQQLFAGRRQSGGAVSLTLDAATQRATYTALNGTRGAAVALNARTGAVLALVSTPTFDPQMLAPNDPSRVRAEYERLSNDPAQPLLNRALDHTYSTTSAQQLVLTVAALATGGFTLDTTIPAPARYTVATSKRVVTTADGRACTSTRRITLGAALRTGCTTAFAWLGDQLGSDSVANTSQQLGFDSVHNIPLHAVPSLIGQGGTAQVTVLQLAMLASTIANGGSTMRPYLVRDVRGPDLAVLERTAPAEYGSPVSTTAATRIGRIMRSAATASCTECRGIPQLHLLTSSNGAASVIAYAGDVAIAVVIEPTDQKTAIATVLSMLAAVKPAA